jgi:hypothetical protein
MIFLAMGAVVTFGLLMVFSYKMDKMAGIR